jgi:rapamycin-insensitive companion of mTOR
VLSQFYLDSVIYRVKILPEKHKTIKNPTHFYGELVKTKMGAEHLRKCEHLEHFKKDILSKDTPMLKKRAALWAIGHIGSHENGIKLVLEQELVQPLIKLAENAETLSLRGTCIYIIGMLSNTSIGRSSI